MTQAAAGRRLELDPALDDSIRLSGLAQFVRNRETRRLHMLQRLAEHGAHAFVTLHRDDVPGEGDQVAPVAVLDEEAGRRLDVPGGQGLFEVCQPVPDGGFGSRYTDRSIRGGFGHRGTPSG